MPLKNLAGRLMRTGGPVSRSAFPVPQDIASAWDRLYDASLPYGRKGIAVMALRGVDLALWNLLGQAEASRFNHGKEEPGKPIKYQGSRGEGAITNLACKTGLVPI